MKVRYWVFLLIVTLGFSVSFGCFLRVQERQKIFFQVVQAQSFSLEQLASAFSSYGYCSGLKNCRSLNSLGQKLLLWKVSNNRYVYAKYFPLQGVSFSLLFGAFHFLCLAVLFIAIERLFKQRQLQEKNILQAKDKEKFARMLGHDLRSPLNIIKFYLEQQHNESLKKKMSFALEKIDSIIQNFLEGSCHTKMEKHTKQEILHNILYEKQELFPQINFVQDVSEIESLNLSNCEFSRVLTNLINNSIEAITKTGEVAIFGKQGQEHFELSVQDNGKGIPDEVVTALREQDLTFGKAQGNGLGLAYVKRTLRTKGGKLSLNSNINKGTMVTLIIPNIKVREVVLLDDDELNRFIWQEKAKGQSYSLKTFASWSDLQNNLEFIAKDAKFYVDYELGENEVKGTEVARMLNERGFNRVALASGHESLPRGEEAMRWSCYGKSFPAELSIT